MPTYSLTLKQDLPFAQDLTWNQLDDNFLYVLGVIGTSSGGTIIGSPSQVLYFGPSGSVTSDFDFTRTDNLTKIINELDGGSVSCFFEMGNTLAGTASILAVSDTFGNVSLVGASIQNDLVLASITNFTGNTVSTVFVNSDGVQYISKGGSRFVLPITDGTSGQVINTDGSGNLTFTNPGSIAGTPNQVLYFDGAGNVTSDSNFFRDNSFPLTEIRSIGTSDLGDTVFAACAIGVTAANDLGDGAKVVTVNTGIGVAAFCGTKINFVDGSLSSNLVWVGNISGTGSQFSFNSDSKGNSFQASDGVTNTKFLLPPVDGSNGDVLTTDGAGVLFFTASGGGGSLPSGLDYQVLILDGINSPSFSSVLLDTAGVTSVDFRGSRVLYDASNQTSIDWNSRIASDGSQTSIDWLNRLLKNSASEVTVDWANLTLADSVALISANWGNRVLYDTATVSSVDWLNRNLNDAAGLNSVLWQSRQTLDAFSTLSVDWAARTLNSNGGSDTVDWQDLFLKQLNGKKTVDWGDCILYDINQNETIDWSNRFMLDSSFVETIDWENKIIKDHFNVVSIDWGTRILKDASGTSSLFYGSRIGIDSSNNTSYNWQLRSLYDSAQGLSINWNSRTSQDSTSHLSFDYQNRILYQTGGLTASVNWSSRWLVNSDNTISVSWHDRYLVNIGVTLDWSTPGVASFPIPNLNINNVAYVWPSSQGATSSHISNDGAGNLSWGTGFSGTYSTGDGRVATVVQGIISTVV